MWKIIGIGVVLMWGMVSSSSCFLFPVWVVMGKIQQVSFEVCRRKGQLNRNAVLIPLRYHRGLCGPFHSYLLLLYLSPSISFFNLLVGPWSFVAPQIYFPACFQTQIQMLTFMKVRTDRPTNISKFDSPVSYIWIRHSSITLKYYLTNVIIRAWYDVITNVLIYVSQ